LNGKTYTINGNALTTTGASADTFTFDAATHLLTVTSSIGKFAIDMDDGAYTYEQKGGVETTVPVQWTLIDKDGDVSSPGTLYLLAPVPFVTLEAYPDLPAPGDYDAAHTIIGNGTNQTLNGGSQGDYIDGNGGSDTMQGKGGNDLYVVNSSGDTVVESFNQGEDTVLSSITHTLANNVENLVLTGNANINGTGNDSDNVMIGNSGINTLSGGSGNDIMDGGAGADHLKGDAGNDQFLKVDGSDLSGGSINGGAGDDLVDLSLVASFKSSSGNHTNVTNVEVLSFTGGAGTAVALDYNSVLTMTDSNNNLVIHGDQGSDSVALSGGFTKIGTDVTANDGGHYDVFQAGSGVNQVTVFVDHNLNATAT
jgi:serralysin